MGGTAVLHLSYSCLSHTSVLQLISIKGIPCEVPFFGASPRLLSYSVGAMVSCNYMYHK